jgi:uncharacterized membrane protein YheB (UPF0754 family)
MIPEYIIFPIAGFFIGWITNVLAIAFLFHPRRPILGIQGIIPKRKKEIANRLSHGMPVIMPEWFQAVKSIPKIGPKIEEAFKMSVEKRINSMNNDEIERLVKQAVKKEFLFIEIAGGVLGALIGMLQILFI